MLTYRQLAIESALADANQDTARLILQANLIVEVAAEVVAGNDTQYLDVLVHLLVQAAVYLCGIFLLQFGDGDDIGSLQFVVADGRAGIILFSHGISITVAHA